MGRKNYQINDIHTQKGKETPPTLPQTNPHPTPGCLSVNYLVQEVGWGDQNHKNYIPNTRRCWWEGGGTGQQVDLKCGSPARPALLSWDEINAPARDRGRAHTHHAHSRPGHACPRTHIPNTHAHTHPMCIYVPDAQGRPDTHSSRHTHVPRALTHVHLKAAEHWAGGE